LYVGGYKLVKIRMVVSKFVRSKAKQCYICSLPLLARDSIN
jgi:hypothetical protein